MRFTFLCKTTPPDNGRKVAIIGAGPSGLAAAGYLACMGYRLEVYDKLPKAGGLMVFGIPGHRIPQTIIEEAVHDLMVNYQVKFKLNTKICGSEPLHQEAGDDFAFNFKSLGGRVEDNDAVLICTGTWKSKRLNIPGSHLPGVYSGLEFLFPVRAAMYDKHNIKPPEIKGKNIAVIGAGFTAVDVMHAAQANDAENVYHIYRRTRSEAPCGSLEMNMLEQVGVKCIELATPIRILGQDKVEGLEFARCRLAEPDDTGRCRSVVCDGELTRLEVDMVVTAIGEMATPPFAHDLGLDNVRKGQAKWLHMTKIDSVFVAGDALTGPSRIGHAVFSGLKAAQSLDQWISLKRQNRVYSAA
ncbi:MAG: glutamate synthase [Desulfonatronovibrio sp. MSAO_Bac4]|nr:MAG: glutamate synthase [Desulfonatronovibrio sp. MSAO_Bac4]